MKSVSLESLKAHLFETLEGVKNLNDPEASDTEKCDLDQAQAIVSISGKIVDVYKLQVDAMRSFSKMDNVASTGSLMMGLGIIDDENAKQLGE